ncbi:MAG: glycoside hydrolase family 140 protein [Sedimentisphaerales bacterium]
MRLKARETLSICIYKKLILPGLILTLSMSVLAGEKPRSGPSVDFSHGDLKVSNNKRFIVHEDGTPFFYLGDTAWELFHRLSRKEAERYLENRRQKGFTVIQAVVLAVLDGLNTPNANGDRPLINNDPTKPNEAYFKHVDYIVNTAEKKGIYIGMLPTWGDKVTKAWGKGPVIFTNNNLKAAQTYGRFLGSRYKDKPNIIWILGGDRVADNAENIWRAMAKGIKEADIGRHLMTYHPQGGRSSAEWFHNDKWLDFNMLQSSHGKFDNDNYKRVSADFNRKPTKPCLDGEPCYEDHPVNWKPKNGWFNDFDVRQAAYWALFAGGFGHTYGCHDIWQTYAPGRGPISSARNYWYDVMDLPGAWDMMHVRNLLESRPFLDRVPDQSLIAGNAGSKGLHIQATRGKSYAFIYLPYGQNVKAMLGKVSGEKVKAWWFDPRSGQAKLIGTFSNSGKREFDPPGKSARGNDWVLVLDDAARQFPKPGTIKK